MNFHGIFTFSLMAIVLLSTLIPGTHAFFHNWGVVSESISVVEAKGCKKHSDCAETEQCHEKVCVSGCWQKDCDSSAMCRVKNHHHECFCGSCYKLVGKRKCELDTSTCFSWWRFW